MAAWENAPRGSRGDKPSQIDGERPGTSAVLYAWFDSRKTVKLFTAAGEIEEWDYSRTVSIGSYATSKLHLCTKLTNVGEGIDGWPDDDIDADDVTIASGDHIMAVRLRRDDRGEVVFIDLRRGSEKDRCQVGDFSTMRLTSDGSAALFIGDGPLRVFAIGRDDEAREWAVPSPAGDRAYWGLRGRAVYTVSSGGEIRAYSTRTGELDGSLPAALAVNEAWRLDSIDNGKYLIETSGRRVVIRKVGPSYRAELVAVLELPAGIEQVAVGEEGDRLAISLSSRDVATFRLR
jgi:hypothetical protein